MFEAEIFLGFIVDPLFASELDKVNPNLVKQFVNDQGDQLTQVTVKDTTLIGKSVGKFSTLSKLNLIENNIFSVLKKLVPNFKFDETALYLVSFKK